MTQEHPITPPPELTQEWSCDCPLTDPFSREFYVATQAARWGADQELEACCEWILRSVPGYDKHYADYLRAARRPKPPSLKEQAFEILDDIDTKLDAVHYNILRRALEQLND